MATPANCPEEWFTVYWKIKNFSYCYSSIRSPEFKLSGCKKYCDLNITSDYVSCAVPTMGFFCVSSGTKQISILTCDGSPEVLFSSNSYFPKNVIFGKRRKSFLPKDTLTVRIRFPKESKRANLFIYSQVAVNRKYFLWTFKDNWKNQSYEVEASELYGCISLQLKSMCVNNPDEQFTFEISRSRGVSCFCVLKLAMVDVDGKAVNEVSDEFVFEKTDGQQTRGFPMVIKKSHLLECKDLLLPNDTLTLKCFFAVSLVQVTNENTAMSYCENSKVLLKEAEVLTTDFNANHQSACVTELQTHLKSILDEGTLHDVSIQIGSEVIPAHKTILGARSPVFRAMFDKDMQEAINCKVVIEDLDVETVRGLLLYMYTDSIADKQWENVKKLYLASDKYEVLSLKEKCVFFLQMKISISNVCET